MCDRCRELELEIAALRKERDMLLEEKKGAQQWLGSALHGTPLDPVESKWDANVELANRLAQQYPDRKITAIKQLRAQSETPDLSLKEAKDYIDRAYDRALRQSNTISTAMKAPW